jgi:hypothetical protein
MPTSQLFIDAISRGELYSLDMGTMTSASGNAISWKDVEKPPFTTNGNDPVMALAQNHIHFLDLQNVPAGQAQIYVIHCRSHSASTQRKRLLIFTV